MPILTAEQILTATDTKHADVPVEEWGGTVRIRVLSGRERNALEREATGPDGKASPLFRERMLVKCLCDETNKPLFSSEQVAVLAEKNGVVLDRLFDAALRLNGFKKDTVEELEKNS